MLPRAFLAPGYDVSRIIKGGWQLWSDHGRPVEPDEAIKAMWTFVDAGVTTFDCADIYTGVEALIGRFLGELARARGRAALDRVQIHTKFVPNRSLLPRIGRGDVESAIDGSLSRLGVERLDVVQFHWWDYDVPRYVDVAQWLAELQRAGKIRHLGTTNFDTPRLREMVEAGVRIASHQVQYSILDRRVTHGQAAFCAEHGIALLCYGSLAGGFLSKRYLDAAQPVSPQENRSLTKYALIIDEFGGWPVFQTLLRALSDIGNTHGVGPGAVAIAWLLAQPTVAAAIVGARDLRHLDEIGRAATLRLREDDLARIAAVHAHAGGPAGDVYDLERVKDGRHAAIMRYELNGK